MGLLSIIPVIGPILDKAADRLIPDKNKAQDQSHDRTAKQIDATIEGERNRNWYTPRAIVLYGMAFSVVYGVVVQPMLKGFGIDAPVIDYSAPLRILLGLLGLELV